MLNHTEDISTGAMSSAPGNGQPLPGARLNRRRFLQAAGVTAGTAGALAVTGCTGLLGVTAEPGPPLTPAQVLNFALNLEYLEAQFYSYIVNGEGIPNSLLGSSPGTVEGGGAAVKFQDKAVEALAQQLAADEMAHVAFLRAAMQLVDIEPVSMPSLKLTALGAVTDDASFLALARALETVGTSAYEGGIQYLAISAAATTYAALIHDTEAQHEGALRQFCIAKGVSSPAVDAYDRPPVLGTTTMFNTSTITGLNTARNASQVLQIVYAAPGQTGVSSGGFYPAGMNGSVRTS